MYSFVCMYILLYHAKKAKKGAVEGGGVGKNTPGRGGDRWALTQGKEWVWYRRLFQEMLYIAFTWS
jgi:hypothetical protein